MWFLVPEAYRGQAFGWSIVGAALMMIAMVLQSRRGGSGGLKTETAPHGIVSLELARTAAEARRIIASWDAKGVRATAVANTRLDFLFLAAYSTCIGLGCLVAAASLREHRWPGAALGMPLALGQSIAGLLDAAENVAMLVMLRGSTATTEPWPRVARACAIPKFILVACGLIYSLFGAVAWCVAALTSR